LQVLDPTHEANVAGLVPPPRLNTLAGKTVGVISNGKQGTKRFFAAIEVELRETHGVADVIWRTKGNYSAPAPEAIMAEAQQWDALISGVGD
jgi:hypothetical protein